MIWEAIESKVSRAELRAAVANIGALAPAPEADVGGEWRAALVERYAVCAAVRAAAVPDDRLRGDRRGRRGPGGAASDLPVLLDARATKRVPAGYLDAALVALHVVPAGWWRRLVMAPERPAGTVDRAAYVFCVLEQFHQRLRRRDIFAVASSRWADPRARLLSGPAWETARGPVLNALQLPTEPEEFLGEHARELDQVWRHVAEQVDGAGKVSVDSEGRLHTARVDAIPDPPTLTALRQRCEAMLPQVDIGS